MVPCLAALAALVGCAFLPPTELATVDQAPQHPRDRRLTFRADADTTLRGHDRVSAWSTYSRVDRTLDRIVVPLFVPGADPRTTEIPAWVTHEKGHYVDEPFDHWFDHVERTFDGETLVTLTALNHNVDASWRRAIAEAEARLGVKSHPKAAVFVLRDP